MIQNIEYNNRYDIWFAILQAVRDTPTSTKTVVQIFNENWDLNKYDNVDYNINEVLSFKSNPSLDFYISQQPTGERAFVDVTNAYAGAMGLNIRRLKTATRFAILNRMRVRKELISVLNALHASAKYVINDALKLAMEREIERRITNNGRVTLKQLNDRGVLTTREYLMAPEMYYYKGK